MSWKVRLYASLPHILVLLGALGVAITNEAWVAIIALSGAWLLPSPVNVSRETSTVETNVSRETSERSEGISVNAKSEPTIYDMTEETFLQIQGTPVPCHIMHGSADPHVLGCKGWANEPH